LNGFPILLCFFVYLDNLSLSSSSSPSGLFFFDPLGGLRLRASLETRIALQFSSFFVLPTPTLRSSHIEPLANLLPLLLTLRLFSGVLEERITKRLKICPFYAMDTVALFFSSPGAFFMNDSHARDFVSFYGRVPPPA